ncbi:MAG TPA: aspartate kinase [Gemmataceae bacterium]|nr:aspartate kinase [Gemmataceae bacterium]
MPLIVQKFGGTSVATAERIMAAARRAIRAKQADNQVVVVVSARGDTTDDLIELAREISDQPPAREMDMLLATGEQITIALLAMAIHTLGETALSFTGAQVGIVTDSTHTKARIKSITTDRLSKALQQGNIVIVAGFQGIDEDFNITTLGRGGSDTTAVALAAVLKHDPKLNAEVGCEIYTDVDGVYTTDPRLVPEARKMDYISYDEMLELASAGAAVMHSRSIEFAKKYDVPVMVRSSFSDVEGTWIVPEAEWMHAAPVCGVAMVKDEARILLDGVPDIPGVSHRVFSALAAANIVVDMIAQGLGSDGRAAIGFTVPHGELKSALKVLQPLAKELGARVQQAEELSKVSVVGSGMRTHTGVAEKMFAALSAEKVNMHMITTGDIKISVLVDKKDGLRAVRAVHQAFGLHQARPGIGLPAPANALAYALHDTGPRDSNGRDLITRIQTLSSMEDIVVSDIRLATNHGEITVYDLPDEPGNCSKVFQAIAANGIIVDMIVQNLGNAGRAELSFSVPRDDLTRALKRTQDVTREIDPSIRVKGDADIAVLFVFGVGMRTHTGVAQKMFGALAEKNINIIMINTSEVCISVVVERTRGEEALACLRQTFGVA